MPLTNTQIKNAKPGSGPPRLYDEKGLYLEISSNGGKWWRFKYRFNGKEKRHYPGTVTGSTLCSFSQSYQPSPH